MKQLFLLALLLAPYNSYADITPLEGWVAYYLAQLNFDESKKPSSEFNEALEAFFDGSYQNNPYTSNEEQNLERLADAVKNGKPYNSFLPPEQQREWYYDIQK